MFQHSTGKVLCREQVWKTIGADKGFCSERHLVLAGEQAGDVPILLRHGVKEKQIVIIDVVRKFTRSAATRWPQAAVHTGDVLNAILTHYPKQLGSVYLDWCGTISESNVARSVLVACEGLKLGGYVACTFFGGRETETKISTEIKKYGGGFFGRSLLLGNSMYEASVAYTDGKRALVPKAFIYYKNATGKPMITYVARMVRHAVYPSYRDTSFLNLE